MSLNREQVFSLSLYQATKGESFFSTEGDPGNEALARFWSEYSAKERETFGPMRQGLKEILAGATDFDPSREQVTNLFTFEPRSSSLCGLLIEVGDAKHRRWLFLDGETICPAVFTGDKGSLQELVIEFPDGSRSYPLQSGGTYFRNPGKTNVQYPITDNSFFGFNSSGKRQRFQMVHTGRFVIDPFALQTLNSLNGDGGQSPEVVVDEMIERLNQSAERIKRTSLAVAEEVLDRALKNGAGMIGSGQESRFLKPETTL